VSTSETKAFEPHRTEPLVSVVIPALNEAGNIGRLVDETFAAVPASMLREVIVVDDGSTDATADEVRSRLAGRPGLKLVRHARPSGQSAAMRTGILAATGPIIATMDGDGQNDPNDIPTLVGKLGEPGGRGPALVGGWRVKREAESSKRWASRFANWLRDALLKDECPDTGCGIKAYRRDAYLLLPAFHGQHRYLPALFRSYGHAVVYEPVNDRVRLAGVSKYTNLGRALIGIYDLIGVRWLRNRTRWPEVVERAGASAAPLDKAR
jgi:dolichol-phosphate mannosyltransferase